MYTDQHYDSLSVLKTTQSGWANFVRDQYTTLPETNERILATTIDAKWAYGTSRPHELMKLDFGGIHRAIRHAFIIAFFGPPDKGVYSKGVQETLFKMGRSAIGARDEVDTVTLSLPNLHFLPCNIPVFQKNAIHFEDDVYIPNDEPHGIITATIGRAKDTGSDSDPTAFRSSLNRRARM